MCVFGRCFPSSRRWRRVFVDRWRRVFQYLHSLTALGQRAPQAKVDEKRLAQVEMALEALRNVIRNNPGETANRPATSRSSSYPTLLT